MFGNKAKQSKSWDVRKQSKAKQVMDKSATHRTTTNTKSFSVGKFHGWQTTRNTANGFSAFFEVSLINVQIFSRSVTSFLPRYRLQIARMVTFMPQHALSTERMAPTRSPHLDLQEILPVRQLKDNHPLCELNGYTTTAAGRQVPLRHSFSTRTFIPVGQQHASALATYPARPAELWPE